MIPQLDHMERLAEELRLAVQDAAVTVCLHPNAEDLRRFRLVQTMLNSEFNRSRDAIVRCAEDAIRARDAAANQHYQEVA